MSCGGNVYVLKLFFSELRHRLVDPTSGIDTLGQAGLGRRRFFGVCAQSHSCASQLTSRPATTRSEQLNAAAARASEAPEQRITPTPPHYGPW